MHEPVNIITPEPCVIEGLTPIYIAIEAAMKSMEADMLKAICSGVEMETKLEPSEDPDKMRFTIKTKYPVKIQGNTVIERKPTGDMIYKLSVEK